MATLVTAKTNLQVWIKPGQARKILHDISHEQLLSILRQNKITRLQMPGCNCLLLRDDVERIAAESVIPAGA